MSDDAAVASSAYVGLSDKGEFGKGRAWRLSDLVGPESKFGFTLVKAVPGYAFFLMYLKSLGLTFVSQDDSTLG